MKKMAQDKQPAPGSFGAQMLQVSAAIESRTANRPADNQSLQHYLSAITQNPKPTRSLYTRASILQAITDTGPVSTADLAYRLELDNSTVSGHGTILESAGLVCRTRQGRHYPDIWEAA